VTPATVGAGVTGVLEGFAVGVLLGEFVNPANVGVSVTGEVVGALKILIFEV